MKGESPGADAGAAPPRTGAWAMFAVLAAAVAAATAWLYGSADRYQPDGRAWVANPDFRVAPGSRLPEGWELEGSPGAVAVTGDGDLRLTNADPAGGVGLRQVLRRGPGDAAVFDLSVRAASDGVAGGRDHWYGGRVTLAEATGGFPRGADKQVVHLRRPSPPAPYGKRFVFGSGTPELELALRVRHATGTLEVRDLRLVGLVERPGFRRAAAALRAAWALLFLGGLALAMGGVRGRAGRALVASLALGGAAVILMPHSGRQAIATWLSERLLDGTLDAEEAARIGHLCLFVVAGAVLRAVRPRDRLPLQFAALALLAGATELAQLMADARSPELLDWAADVLGAAVGLGGAWLLAAVADRRHAAAEEAR